MARNTFPKDFVAWVGKLKRKIGKLSQIGPKLKFYYGWFYKHCRVHERRMLLESFHGKNISDSALAVLQEIEARGLGGEYEIYYGTLDLERDAEFVRQNGLPVKLVNIRSRKYVYILATSKYLLNNSSFPVYFIRRPEQVYVQTWHGTPLKTLGKRMRHGIESMYNVQHNFLQASMLTFPNHYTRNVIMRDYNLADLYTGRAAMVGYPRNAVFMKGRNDALREACGLQGFETFAYMPTWRGKSNHDVDIEGYACQVRGMLEEIDSALDDGQKLFVNFHSMVADSITVDRYEHIAAFPSNVGTYDFLSQIDVLITDYSSVFFDFALTRKPIVLFTYDAEEYLQDRGFYFSFDELPFARVGSTQELCAYLKGRGYKGEQPDITQFERDYLAYDSADNASRVLDLLLGDIPRDIEIIDYASNLEKTWRLFDQPEGKQTVAKIAGMLSCADPERDIVVLKRTGFTEEMSEFVYDNYRDRCNYLFVTRTTPRTYIEDVTRRFSEAAREKLDMRDHKRLVGDLKLEEQIRTDFCPSIAGAAFSQAERVMLPARLTVEGGVFRIAYDARGYEARRVALLKGDVVVWERGLVAEEAQSGTVRLDVEDALRAAPISNDSRLRLALAVEAPDADKLLFAFLDCSGDTRQVDGARWNAITVNAGDLDGAMRREGSAAASPLIESSKGGRISVSPFNDQGAISLHFACEGDEAKLLPKPVSTKISTLGGTSARIDISIDQGDYVLEDVIIANRAKSSSTRHSLAYSQAQEGGRVVVKSSFEPAKLSLDGTFWDLFVVLRDSCGRSFDVPVFAHEGFKRSMLALNRQCAAGGDCIVFPYCAKGGKVSFTYRRKDRFDNERTKIKELAAFAVHAVSRSYWKNKGVWLVYERSCSQARDNAYHFFRYCMQDAPREARKRVYFVIDEKKPDYRNVREYKGNVLGFMSFRHMLYAMAASVYVGSEARSHLYQSRPKPSLVRRSINEHELFYVRNDMTAVKLFDSQFASKAGGSVDYFLSISERDRELVVESLGYDEARVPVLGLPRWDALEDRADAGHPTILVLPTWHLWQKKMDAKSFAQSDYALRYSALLADERLLDALRGARARLVLMVEAKAAAQLRECVTDSEVVQVVDFKPSRLGKLVEECSMLITDYSCAAWDVLYLRKPVIYYQFDKERYLAEVGSPIDFESELPGAVCIEHGGLVDEVVAAIGRGFAMPEIDVYRSSKWIGFRDGENSRRVYDALEGYGF